MDDIVLPALHRPSPEIVVVYDTSGSMHAEMLSRALAEVEGLVQSQGLGRHLRVLSVDTQVQGAPGFAERPRSPWPAVAEPTWVQGSAQLRPSTTSRYDRRGDKARRSAAERLSLDLGVASQPPSEHDEGPESQGDAR